MTWCRAQNNDALLHHSVNLMNKAAKIETAACQRRMSKTTVGCMDYIWDKEQNSQTLWLIRFLYLLSRKSSGVMTNIHSHIFAQYFTQTIFIAICVCISCLLRKRLHLYLSLKSYIYTYIAVSEYLDQHTPWEIWKTLSEKKVAFDIHVLLIILEAILDLCA